MTVVDKPMVIQPPGLDEQELPFPSLGNVKPANVPISGTSPVPDTDHNCGPNTAHDPGPDTDCNYGLLDKRTAPACTNWSCHTYDSGRQTHGDTTTWLGSTGIAIP